MPAKTGILLIPNYLFWRYLKVGLSTISFLLVLDTKLPKSNFTQTDVKKDAVTIPNALACYLVSYSKLISYLLRDFCLYRNF